MTIRDADAFAHPSYAQAQALAARYAFANKGEAYAVYFDGRDLLVYNVNASPPRFSRCVCIAQRWHNNTVKLNFGTGPAQMIQFDGMDWKVVT